jgi:hypothetical protein
MVFGALTGWLERREREAIAYLMRRTGSFGVSWADDGCGSRGPTPVGGSRAPGYGYQRDQAEREVDDAVRRW